MSHDARSSLALREPQDYSPTDGELCCSGQRAKLIDIGGNESVNVKRRKIVSRALALRKCAGFTRVRDAVRTLQFRNSVSRRCIDFAHNIHRYSIRPTDS